MKEEDIHKAAIELCTTEEQEEWLKDYGIHCFLDGARWRINSVWHTTADKPDFMRLCFLYLSDQMREGWHIGRVEKQGTNKGKWNIYGYFTPALHKYVARWAYIDDLLPDRKEEEK